MQGTSGDGDPIQQETGSRLPGQPLTSRTVTLSSTGVSSNMALQGNGFFVVKDSNGVDYTRNGDFTVNSQGQLCTQGGQLVMGYPAVNGVVQTGAAVAPITVNQANNIPASATTSFQMTTNLDATAAVGTTYSSPMTVYDSLGESHALTIQYTNTAPNTWTYNITLPAADTGGTGDPTQVATGTLNFDSSGVLTSPSGTVPGISIAGSCRWGGKNEFDLEFKRQRRDSCNHPASGGQRDQRTNSGRIHKRHTHQLLSALRWNSARAIQQSANPGAWAR